jgi:hypothetical protein
MGKVAEWRWQTEGENRNRALVAQEIIDSNNEIYLMSLNKSRCKEKRENKQNMRDNQSCLYNYFLYTPRTQMPCMAQKT